MMVVVATSQQDIQNVPLEVRIQRLTGSNVVNCGIYKNRPDPEAMLRSLACGRKVNADHKPFTIIQWLRGEDSGVAFGVVGQTNSETLWFDYDSAPCGGRGCAERFDTKRCDLSDVFVMHDANGIHSFRCPR